ncbi:MAG TPA: DUF6352 family protein [Usitatibacteraceae bacterium]|nr:DUF6352 family protein [Usitatibacteraceae bacterium]
MQDFWAACGYRHLARNASGQLGVTADYVRHWLQRPELAPIDESGPAERALHASLLADPLRVLDPAALGSIEDADTRDNYRHFARLREGLCAAPSLEHFYLGAFRAGAIDLPPLFFDLIAQAILRGMLDGCTDPYAVRAAEMLFRRQRISTEGGQTLAADAETIQLFAETGGFGSVGRLLREQGTPVRTVNMDVLGQENAPLYWMREGRHAWLLDLTMGREGLGALARVLERWVAHMLGATVSITPVPSVADPAWTWHCGLDAESSAMLNDLYRGEALEAGRQARLVALFRLEFADPADVLAAVAGKPVWLGLAMNEEHLMRIKPQNLLLNLPLARRD